MGRWPERVREPLPIGRVTEADIDEALLLTVRYLDDPEDPAFDQAQFGFVCAIRAVLIECDELLHLNRIGRELAKENGGPEPGYRE